MQIPRLALKTAVAGYAAFKFEWHPDHEGEIVRYYRDPNDRSFRECGDCGRVMHDHGWIDHGDHGHVVCPGDYVICVGGACRRILDDDGDTAKANYLPVRAILVESGVFEVLPELPKVTG